MKIEKIKEKYLCEIKWGVYYFVSTLIIIIIDICLRAFIFNSTPDLLYSAVILFCKTLVYLFSLISCILEINRLKGFSLFSKLGSVINILFFSFIFTSLIFRASDFIIPKHEIEIQIIKEDESDTKRKKNLLNSFITKIKLKISRL